MRHECKLGLTSNADILEMSGHYYTHCHNLKMLWNVVCHVRYGN